mgnify:CR=1 FL=1
MPTFKVYYPTLVIQAPDFHAARKAYNGECASSFKYLPFVDLSHEEPDMVVDADGYEIAIEEEEE